MSLYDTIDRIDAQAFQDAQSMKDFDIGNGQSSKSCHIVYTPFE